MKKKYLNYPSYPKWRKLMENATSSKNLMERYLHFFAATKIRVGNQLYNYSNFENIPEESDLPIIIYHAWTDEERPAKDVVRRLRKSGFKASCKPDKELYQ